MNEHLPEIEQLGLQAADCQRCALAERRTQVVWGDGPATAKVVFIGEAPGRKEDEGGRPFIGAAGHLLDELLQSAHITRADVYITNIVKCRPPGNRDPLDDEIVACRGYLNRQLQLLHPKVIVTLGRFSTHLILQTTESISRLQGRVFERHGYKVLPLYHPAAAIYDLMKKEPLFAAAPILDELVNGAPPAAPGNTSVGGDALGAPPAGSGNDTQQCVGVAERPEKAPVEPSQRSKGELGEPPDALGAPPAPAQQDAPAQAAPTPAPRSPHFTQETLDIWNA